MKKSLTTPKAATAGGKPYHHGALPAALLAAARRLIEQDGVEALTLRAAARAAGVSHAAPKNHFGDLTGLLSELAAQGFEEFSDALEQVAGRDAPPVQRLQAIGRCYVDFARTHPGMFLLMFRSTRLDMQRPALQLAYQRSRLALAAPLAASRGYERLPTADEANWNAEQSAAMVRAWALVHGFAMLLIDGRLDPLIARLPEHDGLSLLELVFAATPPPAS